ncbi:hypothetical protein MAR_037823 [Mya arenaria]|uniref:CSPP1 n=1 Tax=Mya arenaria TaxID=6604 RepID=A0ABY7FTI2_MYAAR|nr:hypothetical protein MAR_037823 [Mya arenaria]
MAALAMDYSREPEMARFIDTHKFDQDMSTKRDKFGGGTSLPLNSDGYENKQQQLRDERHIDWMRQQEKGDSEPHAIRSMPRPVTHGPQTAADYEAEIQRMTDRYHNRYNEVLFEAQDKQKESEKQKFEARRQAQPTGAPAAGPQIDYDRNNEMAKQEDRKAYQDYMGKYQHPQNASQKPPINYEENRRVLNEERKRDYNQLMEKKAKEERYWAMRGRPVTPPGGLNIGSYERHQKESAEQKKKEYKEMLDQKEEKRDKFRHDLKAPRKREEYSPESHRNTQYPKADDQNLKAFIDVEREKRENQRQYAEELAQQQREHMYLKARQEPEVAVMDRSGVREQYLASKPPAGPGFRPRDEAFKTPYRPIQQHPARPSPLPDNSYSQNQRPIYNELDPTSQRARSRGSPDQGRGSRRSYEAERRPGGQGQEEMNDKSPRRKKQSLYNDNEDVLAKRDKANKERQEEYNEYIKMKNEERRRQEETRQPVGKPAERVRSPHYSSDDYESWRRKEQQKLGKEYQDYLKERGGHIPNPIDAPVTGPQGLNIDVSFQPKKQAWLEKERNRDYNEFLKKDEDIQGTNGIKPAGYVNSLSHRNHPPPSPYKPAYHQKPPSPMIRQQSQDRSFLRGSPSPGRSEPLPAQMPTYQQPSYITQNENERVGNQRMEINYGLGADKFNQGMTGPYPKARSEHSSGSRPATPSKLSLPLGQYDDMRPFIEKQRNKDYNNVKEQSLVGIENLPLVVLEFIYFSTMVFRIVKLVSGRLPPMKKTGIIPKSTDVTLPVGQYEEMKNIIEKQRNREYNDLIKEGKIGQRTFREKIPTPPNLQGLPIGQNRYEPMHKAMEYQRNKEYNEFIQKKYGGRTISSRSEPPREKPSDSSFYYGNELEHEEKRKMLDHERRNEYNSFVRERVPPPSKNYNVPTDADSGLPIGQQHHEAWKKFLREQRNKEYNQLVEVKGHDHRNRDWNFEQNGILELRGDDANQSRQRELRAERQKDYNDYKTQMKPAPNHDWPTPNYEKPFITRGAYDGLKELYDEERRKDLQDALERRREFWLWKVSHFSFHKSFVGKCAFCNRQTNLNVLSIKHFLPEIKPRVMSEPIRGRYVNQNPMVDALGRYEDYRQKLNADRKQEWMTSLEQARSEEELHDHQEQDKPSIAGDESPLIHSLGKYETEIRQKVKDQRRKDFVDFTHDQPIYTARSTVRENLMPNEASYETPLVSHMGKYDDEREKFREERHEDLLHYSKERRTQLRDPHDHFVFPTVAAAERPIVAHMGRDVEQRKVDLRSERQRDYEQYQQQHKSQSPGRRHDFVDTAQGPYNGGLFQGLGQRGPDKDGLNQQRKHEYNERLDQNVDRGRSPQRNPGPGGADQYSRMLEEKRREEASRRRFDDPEFQGRLPQSRERDNLNVLLSFFAK